MAVEWAPSAAKHDVPREDVLHAIAAAEVQVELGPGKYPGEVNVLWIGHPHAQTDRYLEVLAAVHHTHARITIFHAMALTDRYRHHLGGTA